MTRSHYDNGLVRRIDGIVDEVVYNARNLPSRVAYSNGVVTEIEYEPGVGLVRRQRTSNAGGMVIEDAQYGYDSMSQLLSLDDSSPAHTRQLHYSYDALRQLQHVDRHRPGRALRTRLRLRRAQQHRAQRRIAAGCSATTTPRGRTGSPRSPGRAKPRRRCCTTPTATWRRCRDASANTTSRTT